MSEDKCPLCGAEKNYDTKAGTRYHCGTVIHVNKCRAGRWCNELSKARAEARQQARAELAGEFVRDLELIEYDAKLVQSEYVSMTVKNHLFRLRNITNKYQALSGKEGEG